MSEVWVLIVTSLALHMATIQFSTLENCLAVQEGLAAIFEIKQECFDINDWRM